MHRNFTVAGLKGGGWMVDEDGFDRFWAEYPKKRSKGDAYKAWRVVKDKRPGIDRIVKAVQVLRASEDWRKDGGQYIPYPGTWLRAWGWEDVPEVKLNDVMPNGKCWWETVSGIEKRAAEIGMKQWDGRYDGKPETWQQWAKRVRAIAEEGSNVVPVDFVDKKLVSAGRD